MKRQVWFAEIRGPNCFGDVAIKYWAGLTIGQPVLLEREPLNKVDSNAIIARDLFNHPLGYIAREVSAVISPLMDKGKVPLARVVTRCNIFQKKRPVVKIWFDADPEKTKETGDEGSVDKQVQDLMKRLTPTKVTEDA